MRSLRVATRNVCHRPIRHVSASSTAHAAGRHLSSPNVFGCLGKQIALPRYAPASAVCAWRSKTSVTAPYRHLWKPAVRSALTAHAGWLQIDTPGVFGCREKQIALPRYAPACVVCAWRPETSVTGQYGMSAHCPPRMLRGGTSAVQTSSGVLESRLHCPDTPLHPQFVRGDPKCLSPPHTGTYGNQPSGQR